MIPIFIFPLCLLGAAERRGGQAQLCGHQARLPTQAYMSVEDGAEAITVMENNVGDCLMPLDTGLFPPRRCMAPVPPWLRPLDRVSATPPTQEWLEHGAAGLLPCGILVGLGAGSPSERAAAPRIRSAVRIMGIQAPSLLAQRKLAGS
jgi:hypothetical protein